MHQNHYRHTLHQNICGGFPPTLNTFKVAVHHLYYFIMNYINALTCPNSLEMKPEVREVIPQHFTETESSNFLSSSHSNNICTEECWCQCSLIAFNVYCGHWLENDYPFLCISTHFLQLVCQQKVSVNTDRLITVEIWDAWKRLVLPTSFTYRSNNNSFLLEFIVLTNCYLFLAKL